MVAAFGPRLVEGLAQRMGELLATVAAFGVFLDGHDELGFGIDQPRATDAQQSQAQAIVTLGQITGITWLVRI